MATTRRSISEDWSDMRVRSLLGDDDVKFKATLSFQNGCCLSLKKSLPFYSVWLYKLLGWKYTETGKYEKRQG